MSAQARVLVVDDDEIVRRSYQRSLATVACAVETVACGEDALKAVAQHPYDVLLLDLRMPGMDGISVLKAVKEAAPDSEVIVITGYPTLETAKEAVQLGAADYLAKPVGPAEVINATHAAMTHKLWALRKEPSTNAPCNL